MAILIKSSGKPLFYLVLLVGFWACEATPTLAAPIALQTNVPQALISPAMSKQIELHRQTLAPYHGQIMQRFSLHQSTVDLINQQLKRQKLPAELILLPMLESSFNADAVSPANAAGLWQLIPATAKRFGLSINANQDQRFDIEASTRAALAYLRFLYNKFEGDLTLTIAAYNAGEGRLQRAINAANSSQFEQLILPKETVNYVYRFHALLRLIDLAQLHSTPPLFMPVSPLITLKPLAPLIEL